VRILLDECIDRGFARELLSHEVRTVPEAGWAGKSNGELLALAENSFDVFVTVDRNLSFQQNVPKFSIAVVVLRAHSSRLAELRRLVPRLLELLPAAKPGEVTWVEI
jgi:hypothetical protein